MTTEALEPTTVLEPQNGVPKRARSLKERLRETAIVFGLCAILPLFVTGITLNVAPVLATPLTDLLCGPTATLRTGLESIPGSRGGAEGFARCVDSAGVEGVDVFGDAFFLYWGVLTLTLLIAVVASGVMREEHR